VANFFLKLHLTMMYHCAKFEVKVHDGVGQQDSRYPLCMCFFACVFAPSMKPQFVFKTISYVTRCLHFQAAVWSARHLVATLSHLKLASFASCNQAATLPPAMSTSWLLFCWALHAAVMMTGNPTQRG
jgi:hypothetical protein